MALSKMVDFKKLNTSTLIFSIVTLIIIFNVLAIGLPQVDQAASNVQNVSAICSDAFGCYWNISSELCLLNLESENISIINSTCASGQPSAPPLSTFFASSGLLILAIISVIIIAVLAAIGLTKTKSKR